MELFKNTYDNIVAFGPGALSKEVLKCLLLPQMLNPASMQRANVFVIVPVRLKYQPTYTGLNIVSLLKKYS